MSKDIIKKKDLKTLKWLENLLMNMLMSSKQLEFLETEIKTERSPCWDKTSSWNKAFVRRVTAASGRIHDLLDAIQGQETEKHSGGLTTAELFKLATLIGIDQEQTETNKSLLWTQIKRRLNPVLSRAETQAILYALIETLTEDEIKWLGRHRRVNWKNYYRGNQAWIKDEATTLVDCSIRIEDILCAMTNQTGFDGYRARISRSDIIALEKRFGISPASQKIWPKGVVKARMLKIIQEAKQKSIPKSFESTQGIPPGWKGTIV